jgi:phospholipid/cholesterol/gamma-HCH transport system substrate-binding protein
MQKHILETLIGGVVLAVAGGFLIFAYRGSDMGLKTSDGYTVQAKFTNATGINIGSDVRVGGIKIGVVSDMQLDPATYEAVAFFQVHRSTKLPKDSSAAIVGSGLLGEKFVQVMPGGDEKMLADGGRIEFTQSAISLEELIGKFVFSGGGVDKGAPTQPAAAAPAPQTN